MPPTGWLTCGSGRYGKSSFSLISSGDIRPNCSHVTPRFSRAVGPTGIGLPRVIFTFGSTRRARS